MKYTLFTTVTSVLISALIAFLVYCAVTPGGIFACGGYYCDNEGGPEFCHMDQNNGVECYGDAINCDTQAKYIYNDCNHRRSKCKYTIASKSCTQDYELVKCPGYTIASKCTYYSLTTECLRTGGIADCDGADHTRKHYHCIDFNYPF